MNWKEFDKEVLAPFENKGDRASEHFADVNVFSYMQIRFIALKAFDAGVASQSGVEADAESRGAHLGTL